MPKISDFPSDTAPEGADLVPFVDVSAGRTERVTLTELAASAPFAAQYLSLAGAVAGYQPRESSFFIPAGHFVATFGTSPTHDGNVISGVSSWKFDATANESIASQFFVPANWATFTMTLISAHTGVPAGDVRLQIAAYALGPAGSTMEGASIASTEAVLTAPGSKIQFDTALGTGLTRPAGGWVRFTVSRMATAGTDTASGDHAVVGVVVSAASFT